MLLNIQVIETNSYKKKSLLFDSNAQKEKNQDFWIRNLKNKFGHNVKLYVGQVNFTF